MVRACVFACMRVCECVWCVRMICAYDLCAVCVCGCVGVWVCGCVGVWVYVHSMICIDA